MNRDITYCNNKNCPLRNCCIRNSDNLDSGMYSMAHFEYDYIHNIITCEQFIEEKQDA